MKRGVGMAIQNELMGALVAVAIYEIAMTFYAGDKT